MVPSEMTDIHAFIYISPKTKLIFLFGNREFFTWIIPNHSFFCLGRQRYICHAPK